MTTWHLIFQEDELPISVGRADGVQQAPPPGLVRYIELGSRRVDARTCDQTAGNRGCGVAKAVRMDRSHGLRGRDVLRRTRQEADRHGGDRGDHSSGRLAMRYVRVRGGRRLQFAHVRVARTELRVWTSRDVEASDPLAMPNMPASICESQPLALMRQLPAGRPFQEPVPCCAAALQSVAGTGARMRACDRVRTEDPDRVPGTGPICRRSRAQRLAGCRALAEAQGRAPMSASGRVVRAARVRHSLSIDHIDGRGQGSRTLDAGGVHRERPARNRTQRVPTKRRHPTAAAR